MFWRTFITNDSYFLSSLSLTRWIWVPRGLHLDQNLSNRLYWMVTLLVCVVGSGSTKIIKILCNVKMSFLHMFSTVLPFSKVYICHLLCWIMMVIDCFPWADLMLSLSQIFSWWHVPITLPAAKFLHGMTVTSLRSSGLIIKANMIWFVLSLHIFT